MNLAYMYLPPKQCFAVYEMTRPEYSRRIPQFDAILQDIRKMNSYIGWAVRETDDLSYNRHIDRTEIVQIINPTDDIRSMVDSIIYRQAIRWDSLELYAYEDQFVLAFYRTGDLHTYRAFVIHSRRYVDMHGDMKTY